MLAGVPWTWVSQEQAGDLIIDPTIALGGSEDVWIEDVTNLNGHLDGLLIGKHQFANKKRTLVEFDLANSGIPANATIIAAQLRLRYYARNNGGFGNWIDRTVQVHQLLRDWKDSEATKDDRLTNQPWNVPYGGIDDMDAKSTPESSLLFTDNTVVGSWQSWDLSSLTEQWFTGSAANHGVILWATNEDVNGYDLRFRSSDEGFSPPELDVIWTEDVKTVYFLKDHLGSIRATVDDIGQVVGYDDYDPWGLIMPSRSMATGLTNIDAAKNRFTSQAWDDEFGLDWNYFGARYYDPEIGRWLSVDPVEQTSLSPFVYAANNPLIIIDPTGADTTFVLPDGSRLHQNDDGTVALLDPIVVEADQDDDDSRKRAIAAAASLLLLATPIPGDELLPPIILIGGSLLGNTAAIQQPLMSETQDKKLSKGEIKKLKKANVNPEKIKKEVIGGSVNTGEFDLFKKPNGDIVVKPKSGKGRGEPTGLNINDFK